MGNDEQHGGKKGSESYQNLVLPEDGTYDAWGCLGQARGENKAVAFAGHISIRVPTYKG